MRKVEFITSITDIITGKKILVEIQQSNDCLWITFGGEEEPRVLIDSVNNKARVGIYTDISPDSEPEIYPTGYERGIK